MGDIMGVPRDLPKLKSARLRWLLDQFLPAHPHLDPTTEQGRRALFEIAKAEERRVAPFASIGPRFLVPLELRVATPTTAPALAPVPAPATTKKKSTDHGHGTLSPPPPPPSPSSSEPTDLGHGTPMTPPPTEHIDHGNGALTPPATEPTELGHGPPTPSTSSPPTPYAAAATEAVDPELPSLQMIPPEVYEEPKEAYPESQEAEEPSPLPTSEVATPEPETQTKLVPSSPLPELPPSPVAGGQLVESACVEVRG